MLSFYNINNQYYNKGKKMATAIFYASSTGNTEDVATAINEKLGGELTLVNVADSGISSIGEYDKIILGTSTWGDGDLQDDWEECIDEFKEIDFSGKTVALFGLGDQEEYPDHYLDAVGILYKVVSQKGANVIGSWSTEGYEFDESKAVVDDNFVGLALDEDNQDDMSDERIATWCEQIKAQIL